MPIVFMLSSASVPARLASKLAICDTCARVCFHWRPGNPARSSSPPSGYSIICQKPSRLAYRWPRNVNGVAAKFESSPSSLRLERITSPGPASCGRISQSGVPSLGTAAHQCAGKRGSLGCPDAGAAGNRSARKPRSRRMPPPGWNGRLAMCRRPALLAAEHDVLGDQSHAAGAGLDALQRVDRARLGGPPADLVGHQRVVLEHDLEHSLLVPARRDLVVDVL